MCTSSLGSFRKRVSIYGYMSTVNVSIGAVGHLVSVIFMRMIKSVLYMIIEMKAVELMKKSTHRPL